MALTALTHNAVCQQLVFHEGFEAPQITPNQGSPIYFDGTDTGVVSGWSSFNSAPPLGSVELINGNPLFGGFSVLSVLPQEGQQFVIFNSGDRPPTVSISRTFATTVGQTYQVSYLTGKGGTAFGSVGLRAEVSDEQGIIAQLDTVIPTTGWTSRDFSFVAQSTTSKLAFRDISQTTSSKDVLLDSVTVVAAAVPEPTTTIFASAMGLFIFGFIRNWRKH